MIAAFEFARLGGQVLDGPGWDRGDESIWCVDIPQMKVHVVGWPSGQVSSFDVDELVSAVIDGPEGVGKRFASRCGVGELRGGRIHILAEVEAAIPGNRANDAACDPVGRLWLGTMAEDEHPRAGALYHVDPDWTVTQVLSDVTISNGIGWNPNAASMYFIDSPTRRVDVFDYDVATGKATDRRPLVHTNAVDGLPDGLAVDVEGCLWIAFFWWRLRAEVLRGRRAAGVRFRANPERN